MSRPTRRLGLVPHHLGGVDLDHDLRVEVGPDVEPEIVVRGPSEAIAARVAASPIRVDGVLEGKAARHGDAVDHRFGLDVEEFEAFVGAASHMPLHDVVEQGLLGGLIGGRPAELWHRGTLAE